MKTLKFVGSSKDDLAVFPEEVRRVAGFELWQVQLGLMPSDFKSMPTVGAGAYEVRIKVGTQWRVIYVANRFDAVYGGRNGVESWCKRQPIVGGSPRMGCGGGPG